MLPNLRIRIRLDERQLTEVVLDEIYHLIGPFGHDGRRPSGHTHPTLHSYHSN